MKPGQKVFGIGLPRCGGQTLQTALSMLLDKPVIHSPGLSLDRLAARQEEWSACVEVFAPIPWILRTFEDPLFILNVRDAKPWFASCKRVHYKSKNWNHPLWFYPLDQFVDYRDEYTDTRRRYSIGLNSRRRIRMLTIDITKKPSWNDLCRFLDLPAPDCPFPNTDRVGRAAITPTSFEVKYNG